MVMPGECVGMSGGKCMDCGSLLILEVLHSRAGYYLGYLCRTCMQPYSRETGYFSTKVEAEQALKNPKIYSR